MLVVEKFPGANTLEVTRRVEEALDGCGPGLAGIAVDTHRLPAGDFIETAIDNLALALLIGARCSSRWCSRVLLRAGAPAVIALVAIPLSLVAAALVLVPARARRSTRWSSPASWSRSASSSTTPSSTSTHVAPAAAASGAQDGDRRSAATVIEAVARDAQRRSSTRR